MVTAAPVLSHPSYAVQAEKLAEQAGISTPLEEQPKLFLDTVWGAQPSQALLGLTAEAEYWRRTERIWHATINPRWIWRNTQAEKLGETLDWAREQNTASYQIKGRGGIFWQPCRPRKSSGA